jgi:hypothetical protein
MRLGVYHPDPVQLSKAPFFQQRIGVTLLSMLLALFGMRLLEAMFFVGIAGSAVVVFISSLGDIREMMSKSQPPAAGEKTSEA